jgi:membrane-bound lytic murein transglycosylase B
MGKPQFISSSYRRYAVDFDDDGRRDLLENTEDVIGSVANYFKRHKWVKGGPIASPAQVTGKKYKPILKNGIRPKQSLSELIKHGVSVYNDYPLDQQSALIALETKSGNEYWVGFDNFYVITRYNHSELYAMAVFQLGQAIADRRRLTLASDGGR